MARHLWTRNDEASNRSAVSRAYYGVFLRARDMAGISERHPMVHQWTQEHYERDGEKGLAKRLRALRRSRNHADYSTERHITRKEAEAAMNLSQQVRAELRVLAGRRQYRDSRNVPVETSDPVNPP
ncbi:hypothetical protein ACQ86G_08660 [Roseateles chitinivorans]|uniref:hypothetical protein n=1 Tax=Roseateles chitinivorans TaxID=2917965 RepID=UPI003D66F7C4